MLGRARRETPAQHGEQDCEGLQRAAHALTNTAQTGLFKQKGASHCGEAPSYSDFASLTRDDQALGGHDDPAAVLAADGVDAAEARNGIAGIDLIHAAASLDQ